jgi:ABC-type glycerol-3-phosphate transport system permease component
MAEQAATGVPVARHRVERDRGIAHTTRPSFKRFAQRVLFWLLIVAIMIYTIFPFYWAIVSSITPSNKLFDTPASYWPEEIDWSHYQYVFRNDNFVSGAEPPRCTSSCR